MKRPICKCGHLWINHYQRGGYCMDFTITHTQTLGGSCVSYCSCVRYREKVVPKSTQERRNRENENKNHQKNLKGFYRR